MRKIIIIGAGGHAKSLIDLILSTGKWQIEGLVGNYDELGKRILGFEVKWNDKELTKIVHDYKYAVLGFASLGMQKKRILFIENLKKIGFILPSIISPNAYISKHSEIGEGTTIGHFSLVNANSTIGKFCIINSQSLIEHDVRIEDFCHISTSVTVNGGVTLGQETFIGSKSMLREGLSIPKGTIISAGKRVMGWPQK